MAGFLFLRARGHRLLLAAALLAILLTTSVLAALAAFAGSVSDAGLRHALQTRDASAAALVITTENSELDRVEAARDAQRGARLAFDGLPVTLRTFERSGPYALPRALQSPTARKGEPDLTLFAAVDRSHVRLSAGTWPAPGTGKVIPVALPEAAAKQLKLAPGPRVLTVTDRMGGPPVRIKVTGTYRPLDRSASYWQLDELNGRGVKKDVFTTYGPLLVDPSGFAAGGIRPGGLAWIATADFGGLDAERIDDLRSAAGKSQQLLSAQPALTTGVVARTSLPSVLDQLERALLVSRATLLLVSLQLVLLAGYTLLLVARLLGQERDSETRVLVARGASRRRLGALAALEALLLALPAAVCAPLLAGPLTRLLAGHGLLARIGLRDELGDTGPTPQLWLIGAAVALACATAVTIPALSAARAARGRARTLPGPLRAGADVALLAVAAVAYWQLDRRTLGSGALSGDREGRLGIDPLLVVAPALALLAGTVLTLRLLPPAARLAERRAARGKGLTASLAGWQFSRRPMRGAGPVLLLVLSVAMGMLAIGQGASWDRSQDDQADFRTGAPIRVLSGGSAPPMGQGGQYDELPGSPAVAPGTRTEVSLSGGRRATVLALDTVAATEGIQLRSDLAEGGAWRLLEMLKPHEDARPGVELPEDIARLEFDLTLHRPSKGGPEEQHEEPALTFTVEDRYGVSYRLPLTAPPADGKAHRVSLDLAMAAGAPSGKPAAPLALTDIEVFEPGALTRIVPKRLTFGAFHAVTADGVSRPVALPSGPVWSVRAVPSVEVDPANDAEAAPAVTSVRSTSRQPLDIRYHTGKIAAYDPWGSDMTATLRITVKREAPEVVPALVTEGFLRASGAKIGATVELPLAGGQVKVRLAGVLGAIPTTGQDKVAVSTDGGADAASTAKADGGAMLIDLRAVNRALATRPDAAMPPSEWWLFPRQGQAAEVAAQVRERADLEPSQVQVRDEVAAALHDDPLGAGPQSALLAATLAAAALAAVGFAVSAAGAVRERSREFAVLRALGAPRRQLARLLALEQSLLLGIALVIGTALGAALTRAVVPLIVLTGQATQPIPSVIVELPADRVWLLLAAVAAAPVAIVVALSLRRGESTVVLRTQGGE
ncbi:FtsX-like permease family protein [Streptomyces sp. NPDC059256]|uniref:FtsX-like permease family protein n=1 Tax=Streptomyces sp. NPDC059256 TaxID=3346794 RepID=UPI003688008B